MIRIALISIALALAAPAETTPEDMGHSYAVTLPNGEVIAIDCRDADDDLSAEFCNPWATEE